MKRRRKARRRKAPEYNDGDLFSWRPPSPPLPPPASTPEPGPEPPPGRSYLIPTGRMRRRCHEYRLNPDWDGLLENDAAARLLDPPASQDAAASIKPLDIFTARKLVDQILTRNGGGDINAGTIVSLELREYVMELVSNGRMSAYGYPGHVRGESVRRRFSYLTGGSKT